LKKTKDALVYFITDEGTKDEAGALFSKYDADGNGTLSREELILFANDCLQVANKESSNIDNVVTMILHYAGSSDDSLSLEEFLNYIKNMEKNKQFLNVDASLIRTKSFAGYLTPEKLEACFVFLDKDKSGFLEKNEIQQLGQEIIKLGFQILKEYMDLLNQSLRVTGYELDEQKMIKECGSLFGDIAWSLMDTPGGRLSFESFVGLPLSFWLVDAQGKYQADLPKWMEKNIDKVTNRVYRGY